MSTQAALSADVYKNGVLAASLSKRGGVVSFQYLPSYVQAGGQPVATTLPLTNVPVVLHGGAIPPFFAGLLPEGRRLTALRIATKTSADDELGLLLAVGSDTVGDVQVVPAGTPPTPAAPLLAIPRDLSEFSFRAALREAGVVDRVSLPGVQEKVSGRVIKLPGREADETVIVKLSPPEYPLLVENEAFFLAVARAASLRTVSWRVLQDGEGVRALIVDRFDRYKAAGRTERLAFEDASQMLGLWPADKYNVPLEEATTALLRLTSAPLVGAQEVFRQVVFAILTGNGDQHAKNLAVLATDQGEWRVSPAFDLPSTVPYGDDTVALTIHGSRSPFSRRILLAFGAHLGLPARAAERQLDSLLNKTGAALGSLDPSALPFPQPVLRSLQKTLDYRRRQLQG